MLSLSKSVQSSAQRMRQHSELPNLPSERSLRVLRDPTRGSWEDKTDFSYSMRLDCPVRLVLGELIIGARACESSCSGNPHVLVGNRHEEALPCFRGMSVVVAEPELILDGGGV